MMVDRFEKEWTPEMTAQAHAMKLNRNDIITLASIDDPVLGPRVQAACAVVDGVDTIATIIARKSLPRTGVIGTVLVAGAASAAGFYFSHRLAHDEAA